ncbi:Kinesin-like protein KIF23 [Chionoecetes opilio]|uniref:Kinesin-like protein KIF23 n=1 Tax=Chionoecetes opilio TaxID=41210 RepID=A0A8J4XML4_CHIOP|nr:Kinesin-like protein KIF23 [Chionoecetes opilio]
MRSGIAGMEKDNLVMRQELSGLRALYTDAMGRVRSLENLLHSAESANESLIRKLEDCSSLRNECDAVREERDMAKVQSHIDKQRMKAKLRSKLELEKVKLRSTLHTELNQQKGVRHPAKTPIKASTSDPKLNMTPGHHKEVPTGTILQPNLHRRKSVTKLRADDFTDPRTTNYCLTTQEQDSHGELETKLFKGEVLPTAGGGAQVVLRDVEVLHQCDPLHHASTPNRKRSSTEGTPSLQERCGWGIGGGGSGVGGTPHRQHSGSSKRPRRNLSNHTVLHLEKLKDFTCAVAVSNRFNELGALEDPVELGYLQKVKLSRLPRSVL